MRILFTRVLGQRGDDVAEGQQPHVDVDALLESFPLSACLLRPFTACQVHEVKFSDPIWLVEVGGLWVR